MDVTEIPPSNIQEEQASWKQRSEINTGSKTEQKQRIKLQIKV